MEITSTRRRTVRLEINMHDLLNLFAENTGMLDVKDFKVLLMANSGDKLLNADITGISLIGVEVQ